MLIESVTQATRGSEGGDDSLTGQEGAVAAAGDGGDEQMGRDEMFDLLRNRRRRDVLIYLDRQPDDTTTLNTLAEHIAARENDVDVDQLSSSQRKRVYIGLYQGHLPKMDDLDVIEYDQDRGTVELGDISQLRPYLYEPENATSRAPFYLALVVSGAVLLGASGLGPTSMLPAVVPTLVSTAALLAVAYLHTVDEIPALSR